MENNQGKGRSDADNSQNSADENISMASKIKV
jgi:hypothetical protein